MKSRILALSLAVVLIGAVFAGCGINTGTSSTTTSTTAAQTGVYTLPAGDGTYASTTSTNAASSSATVAASVSASTSAADTNTGVSISASTTFQSGGTAGQYATGTYTVNTQTSPLSMRLAPTDSDKTVTIRTIPKGTKITVWAVHNGWGYVVYENSGGWVAMKYLKAAS